jgi:hypothetical protein
MARKLTGGLVGSSTLLGTIQISPDSALATAADQNITLSPGGTGIVVSTANVQLNAQTDLRFADSDSSNWVAFQAPATITSNITWTLPATDGTTGQFLSTNASGTLIWASGSLSLTDQTASASTHYPLITTASSGTVTSANVSSTKFTFQPSTGTLSSTIFTETSSIALKENFTPIDDALEKILQLTAWIYDRKDGSQKQEAGLVVEQVYPIIPNVVTLDENGKPSSINYSRFSAYLIEAIKSLKIEIDEIKGVK